MKRHYLYNGAKFTPIYNPVVDVDDLPQPLVVDLTIDVANYTKIIHPYTDEIRALLNRSDFIVCDTVQLQQFIRKVVDRKIPVLAAPFGFCSRYDTDNNDGFLIGLLNHNEGFQLENTGALGLLKRIAKNYLIAAYGEPVAGLDNCETCEDFDEFAARIDILLLPGKNAPPNEIELPLSAMAAGTVVLAANTSSYYALHGAPGVRMLEQTYLKPPWFEQISYFEKNLPALTRIKQLNKRHVENLCSQSFTLIKKIEQRLAQPIRAA